jgi:hypothetical protein
VCLEESRRGRSPVTRGRREPVAAMDPEPDCSWRRPGGGGSAPRVKRGGVNEGNRLVHAHPDPLTQGKNR